MNKTDNFGSKLGAIFAAAGSAVGLGNIWRFPMETGNNGGAAFLLIYIGFMVFFGVPIMVSEFTIGRHSQQSVAESFYQMSGRRKAWRWMGLFPMVAGILVLSYYAVVAAWTLYYTYLAAGNGFAGMSPEDIGSQFGSFISDPWQPIVWVAVLLVFNAIIVAMGVRRGIERGAKIMMPLLFVFILVLVGCSMTLPGAKEGLAFMFKPDFSKVTSSVVLSAMGQAFFSLSVGICCLCTYACYFRKDVNLLKDGMSVATIDTLVAVLSGLIIFPAVFSIAGLSPDSGPTLVYVTLPNVFQQVFAGMPVLSYCFALLFYLLLVMAALTSSISMLEMSAAYFHEHFQMSRPKATVLVSAICLVFGSICSLSFGAWKDVTVFGLGFFDLFDFIVAKFLMPLGGMLICVFLGWIVDEKILRKELTNNGSLRQPLYPVFRFIIRYLAPIGIAIIFITELLK